MTIGERLKHLREGKYSQEELADILKVSNVTISNWENGVQEPRSKRVSELAEVLGTTTEYLLGKDDKVNNTKSLTENKQSSERKENMAILTLENGRKIEAPATPEGYAFLKDLFAMSLAGQTSAVAMA